MAKLDQTVPKQAGDDGTPPDDTRTKQTLALIRTLTSSLPATERDRYFREIAQALKTATAPKAGEVLGTIVRLLTRQKEWSVAEIKTQVDHQGVQATHKEIYNAVGYLARKGRVRRIGYGKYLVDGTLLDTADDFGLENARYEDAYRVDRSTE
jgi:hypothetical protein